jgi:sec-independent protein translocase protein TatB
VFLDPSKLLVILIVALVVLGPDKLPSVARQMGAAWGEIRKFRERLETEVRGTFPDLPSTHQVAQAVRSPLAFLDQLADQHEKEQKDKESPSTPATIQPTPPGRSAETDLDPDEPGSAITRVAPEVPGREKLPAIPDTVPALLNQNPPQNGARSARVRPWRGTSAGEPVAIPDDPSMN